MLSGELAKFVSGCSYDRLPPETVESTKRAFLDWLGSAAAGGREKPAAIALKVVRQQGGNPAATLLGSWEKTSALNAALYNGIASHIVELDDVHRASILHAGAAVIPAALAVAEMVHAEGKDLLAAIAAGFEVAIRVGEAVTPSHYYYWHTTGTCGTFGAAVAAGRLLGLSDEQMVWALGSAGTQAAGLWEFMADGAMSKHLHPAKSSANGTLAALLAAQGFTGASRILEGERGFFRATAPQFDESKVTAGLGVAPYKIDGNSFKLHSSCRHTHPAIDIALKMRQLSGISPERVASITVATYQTALQVAGKTEPKSIYEAKFSIPFTVALAFAKGKCFLGDFSLEALRDPGITALMKKITLVLDKNLDALHPAKWPTRIEITTKDGKTYTEATDFPKGDPEHPASTSELNEKFDQLAAGPWGGKVAAAVKERAWSLERINDVTSMFSF